MRTKLLRLTNYRGVQNLELTEQAIWAIRGGNGVGKTTIVAAFQSLANGGSEPDAVMTGEEEAVIHWVVEIGKDDLKGVYPPGRYTVTKKIWLDGYDLNVKNPKMVRIKSEKGFVDACLPKMAYDPIAFDKLTDEQRAEKLKGILAVRVTADEIRKAAALVNLGPIEEETFSDGVAAIEKFDTVLEGQARELRSGIKVLDGTITSFEETVKGKTVEGVAGELAAANKSHAALVNRLETESANISQVLEAAREEGRKWHAGAVQEDTHWYEEELAKLQEKREQKKKAAQGHLQSIIDGAEAAYRATQEQTIQPIKDEIAQSKADIRVLEDRAAEAAKLSGAIAQLEAWRTEKLTKAENLERTTVARQQLDRLKNKKLAEMTLPGMTIKKGRLYIGDVLSSMTNTAKRYLKWFEIASIYANDGQLIISDDMEHVEDANLSFIENAIKENNMQLLATFVDRKGGPMRITDSLIEQTEETA